MLLFQRWTLNARSSGMFFTKYCTLSALRRVPRIVRNSMSSSILGSINNQVFNIRTAGLVKEVVLFFRPLPTHRTYAGRSSTRAAICL